MARRWTLVCLALFSFSLALVPNVVAQRFYPDDPLVEEPPLWPTTGAQARELSDILELFYNTIGAPGERHPERGIIPAGGVNSMGEVMDGPWYVNRHAKKRMSAEELERGAGNDQPPTTDAPWRVLTVKRYGFRPGILIADSANQLYLLRFDPAGLPELATGAEVVSASIFHALGYFVTENYIVYFDRDQLVIGDGGESITSSGGIREIIDQDIDAFLRDVARDRARGYRAVATRVPGSWEGLLGPYQVFGTRSDDPNDIVPHEHRRDLRGLHVFSSWLNHNEVGAVTTIDAMVSENGVSFIRHLLIDFYSSLGSGGTEIKPSWQGNEKTYDFARTFKNIAGMGIYTPKWMRSHHPRMPAAGRFGYEYFDPERWTAKAETAPFANRLPDDTYWAARQVMAFTDDDIRALVSTGEYSDPEAEAWIAKCLMERRDRIGATYFAKVLPIDGFEVVDGELHFTDLAVNHGLAAARDYQIRWSRFDNETETHQWIGGTGSQTTLPPQTVTAPAGSYFAATITGAEPDKEAVVYLRNEADTIEVVGVERSWPGKVVADASLDADVGTSRYDDLTDRQKTLFQSYTKSYNETTGFDLTESDYFNSMTISERTTYDAVSHALMNSTLTDAAGNDLGTALDLVANVERVAGQYYGRSGDQQFRLYVLLNAGARQTLESSQEFALGHLNTVYHVGYPYSFRQQGGLPNMQFSISEDGTKADIDVDYRSSKLPNAMFNGHLTSSNSDIRAGDNHEKHQGRWGGFVAWWRGVFGELEHHEESGSDVSLLSRGRLEVPTPLPPNRPPGANPDALEDAAQEFLTDWLVRGNVDEALGFVSMNALACLDTDDVAGDETLTPQRARALLVEAMKAAASKLDDRNNLTEAVEVVLPWRESIRVMEHPYDKDFALMELTNRDASVYLCGNPPVGGANDSYGTYFGAMFEYKLSGSAVIGLLWAREDNAWRIVAWEVFRS